MTGTETEADQDQIRHVEAGEASAFDGSAEMLELLRELCRRPRFGESPRGTRSERTRSERTRSERTRGSRTRRWGLPLVYLARPSGTQVLRSVSQYLNLAQPGRVPHAYHRLPSPVDQLGAPVDTDIEVLADLGSPPGRVPAEDDIALIRAILAELASQLGGGRNARHGRIRFRLFEMVAWLLDQSLRATAEDPDRVLLLRLAERVGADPGSLWFRAAVSGRLPFVGGRYRWLLTQPYLCPHDPGTFIGFAERLTAEARTREDLDQVRKLLVNAFLEDLRRAFRRRPWRPTGARRTTYPVVLLDDVEHDNGGYRLLKLIGDVRDETGRFDPLLMVAAGERVPPEAEASAAGLAGAGQGAGQSGGEDAWPIDRIVDGYQAWSDRLVATDRSRALATWYLPVRVPSLALPRPREPRALARDPKPASDPRLIPEPKPASASHGRAVGQRPVAASPPTIDRPPWWSRPGLMAFPVAVVLAAVVTPAVVAEVGFRSDHCGVSRFTTGVNLLRTVDGDHGEPGCVGVSDGSHRFGRRDRRLTAVQERIYQQNLTVEAECRRSGRRCVTLAYLVDLSSDNVVSGREGLVGALALQARQLRPGNGPLLRVLVANAGSAMRHGPDVVRLLGTVSREDPSLIGVIGLDQSHGSTARTVQALTDIGLPMIAATPAGDDRVAASPIYFQIAPGARREAAVVARYVRQDLESEQPALARSRQVRIVTSSDPSDHYSRSLTSAAAAAFGMPDIGYRADPPQLFRSVVGPGPDPRIASDAIQPYAAGRRACGYPGVVFFAGRAEDFREFLDGVNDTCKNYARHQPRIVAGDDIARFVGDRSERDRYPTIAFDYVSFAAGHSLCELRGDLRETLEALSPGICDAKDEAAKDEATGKGGDERRDERVDEADPSLEDYAMLSYDATNVMVASVRAVGDTVPSPAIVLDQLANISGAEALDGNTGLIAFDSGPAGNSGSGSNVPADKALAVLRVRNSGRPEIRAVCGSVSGLDAAPWCPCDGGRVGAGAHVAPTRCG